MSNQMQQEQDQADRLAMQVRDWTGEIRRLVGLIAAAKGANCAVVMISGTGDEYADVDPEFILQDALRVAPHGWPAGFDIELLNPASA